MPKLQPLLTKDKLPQLLIKLQPPALLLTNPKLQLLSTNPKLLLLSTKVQHHALLSTKMELPPLSNQTNLMLSLMVDGKNKVLEASSIQTLTLSTKPTLQSKLSITLKHKDFPSKLFWTLIPNWFLETTTMLFFNILMLKIKSKCTMFSSILLHGKDQIKLLLARNSPHESLNDIVIYK